MIRGRVSMRYRVEQCGRALIAELNHRICSLHFVTVFHNCMTPPIDSLMD